MQRQSGGRRQARVENRGDEKSCGAACQRRSALNGPVTAALAQWPPPPNSAHSQNITTHLHTDSSRDIRIHSLVTLSCVGNVLSSHQTSRVIGRFFKNTHVDNRLFELDVEAVVGRCDDGILCSPHILCGLPVQLRKGHLATAGDKNISKHTQRSHADHQ